MCESIRNRIWNFEEFSWHVYEKGFQNLKFRSCYEDPFWRSDLTFLPDDSNSILIFWRNLMACLRTTNGTWKMSFHSDSKGNLVHAARNSNSSKKRKLWWNPSQYYQCFKKARLWVWTDIWQFTSSNPGQTIAARLIYFNPLVKLKHFKNQGNP